MLRVESTHIQANRNAYMDKLNEISKDFDMQKIETATDDIFKFIKETVLELEIYVEESQ